VSATRGEIARGRLQPWLPLDSDAGSVEQVGVIKDNQVVLVLGAGASHPYGFPVGPELVDKIKGIQDSQSELAAFTTCTGGKWDHSTIRKFCDELRLSSWLSIDRFLQRRPELADIGKATIAFQLLQHERRGDLNSPGERKWYQYFYNYILNPVSPEQFGDNQLAVITYNYDRSFEQYLFDALQSGFNLTHDGAALAVSKIPFVHVHGSFGDVPGAGAEPRLYQTDRSDIFRATKRMHIVSDDVASSGVLTKCDQVLRQATHVVFLGFGYDPVNVERLGLTRFRQAEYWGTVCGLSTSEVATTVQPQFAAVGSQLQHERVDVDCLRFLRERREIFR
jgi:hypothetical protein